MQPRHNESLTHLFAVYDIAEYLENKGFQVQNYATKKPDIVFKKGKKTYAIEVETSSGLSKPEILNEKVRLLNENYDKWFFVVTDKTKVAKYRKFGKTIDPRFLRRQLNKNLNLKNRQ